MGACFAKNRSADLFADLLGFLRRFGGGLNVGTLHQPLLICILRWMQLSR